ncbi:unnamed protein product, partial [Iphiclides podalirius]
MTFLLLQISRLAAQESLPLEVQCLAGTEWESFCHQCRCLPDGTSECHKQESCASSLLGAPISCKPHTIFHRDCNMCRCLVDGQVTCTDKNCKEPNITKRSELLSGRECSSGTKWTSQCNECACNAEGYPVCTTTICPGQENERVLRCAPQSVWKNDCNTCWCTYDGYTICTRVGCFGDLPESDFHVESDDDDDSETDNEIEAILINDSRNLPKRSVCKPNKEFQMDCNPCKCAADGQSFTCERNECMDTDKDSGINKDVEVFMKSETLRSPKRDTNGTKAVICSANRMFIKDCNTCWCNEDGTSYFCTRKVCIVETPEDSEEVMQEQDARKVKQTCRPDEVFEMDCNMCRCNADGTSFSCTRRACYPDEDLKDISLSRKTRAAPQEPPKACQPGQVFRLDCNKCLCDNEGQDFSCTRNDCNALTNNINGGARSKRDATEEVSANCTAGSVYQQGCNVCRCGADGRTATCTAHNCDAKVDDGVNAPAADPNFRCNPGEQFKSECNDCTCTADGKSVFCTLRLCPVYKP